jgi:hypothetical protein
MASMMIEGCEHTAFDFTVCFRDASSVHLDLPMCADDTKNRGVCNCNRSERNNPICHSKFDDGIRVGNDSFQVSRTQVMKWSY